MDVLERIKKLEEEHVLLVKYLQILTLIRQNPGLDESWKGRDEKEEELRNICFELDHPEKR